MATWRDVTGYVRSNYKIAEEQDNGVKMVFDTGDLRSQVVFLWRQVIAGDEWLQIESPIGEAGSINLQRALEEAGRRICGGLTIDNGHVFLRHAVPLLNLDINEFEQPLILVTKSADVLEETLVGGDRY